MLSRIAHGVAIACAAGASIYLLFAPLYPSQASEAADSPGPVNAITGRATMVSVNGPRIMIAFAIPLLLVAAPLLTNKPTSRKIATLLCGILLLGFVVLGSMSIGLFYLPSAFALLISAAAARASPTTGQAMPAE